MPGSSWHGPRQPCRRVMGLSPAQRQQDAALVLAILNGRNCLASSFWDKVDLILGHPQASGKTSTHVQPPPPPAFSKRCPRLVQRVILALLWPGSLSCLLTRQAERIMMLILTLFLADKSESFEKEPVQSAVLSETEDWSLDSMHLQMSLGLTCFHIFTHLGLSFFICGMGLQ